MKIAEISNLIPPQNIDKYLIPLISEKKERLQNKNKSLVSEYIINIIRSLFEKEIKILFEKKLLSFSI